MIKEIYPIGSKVIVKRNEIDLLVMIIGRIQKIDENSFHDYIGMYYPVGFIGFDELINFQEEQVVRVVELGYVDEEELKIKDELKVNLKG